MSRGPGSPTTLVDAGDAVGARYWAVIDPTPSPLTTEALRYALEPFLPVSIDEVQCRFVRVNPTSAEGGKAPIIACATEDGATSPLLSLPEFIAERIAPELHADMITAFAGKSPRDSRYTLKIAALCGTIALTLGLACIGMLRRAEQFRRTEADAHAALEALVADTLGPPRGAEASLPPPVRLQTETRQLERTRSDAGSQVMSAAHDVGGDYIALLAAWPESMPTRVEQIDLRAWTLTVRGSVRDAADFESLKRALADSLTQYDTPTGSATRARGGVEGVSEGFAFDLAMRRAEAP